MTYYKQVSGIDASIWFSIFTTVQGWIYSKRGPCSEKNVGAPNIYEYPVIPHPTA